MGNSASQRANSPASGLGFYLSYSVTEYLIGFFKQKSIFVPKNFAAAGLPVIIHDSIPVMTPNPIVFPPLIALQILYTAPGELWNWSHPKQQDVPTTRTIHARDEIVIPTNPDEITNSEEYTCVVSIKDGYPKMTHFYGNIVLDCHSIPSSMAAKLLGSDNNRPMYRRESSNDNLAKEYLNYCYICRKNKQMSNNSMDMDGGLPNQECDNNESEITVEIEEGESHRP